MEFTATIEAEGFGDAQSEGDNLLAKVPDELGAVVAVDQEREMIRLAMILEGAEAAEVHDQAMQVWADAWDEAFHEAPTMQLAVVVRPFDQVRDGDLVPEREEVPA